MTQHNPLVDWRKGTLEFNAPEPADQSISPRYDLKPQNPLLEIPPSSENLPIYPIPASENQLSNDQSSPEKPQISLVNAAVFKIAYKTKRAISFPSYSDYRSRCANRGGYPRNTWTPQGLREVCRCFQYAKSQNTPRASTLQLSHIDRGG